MSRIRSSPYLAARSRSVLNTRANFRVATLGGAARKPDHLAPDQPAVGSIAPHQAVGRAILQYIAFVQHDDPIETTHGRQAMGNCDNGSLAHEVTKCLPDRF